MLRLLLAAVAALSLMAGGGVAQTVTKFGTDNRAMTIGDLSEEQALAALKERGRVSMSGTFFGSNSAALTANAGEVLFRLANVLGKLPNARLAVVGHTDNTGDLNANMALSQARAQAVVDALLADPNNVAPDRLAAVGVGALDPIASNISEEGRALNRRVTFVLIGGENAQADASAGAWLTDPLTGCAIWTDDKEDDTQGAIWIGACINGEANGRGTLLFWDSKGFASRYDGDVVNGRTHGEGTAWLRSDDDTGIDKFEGTFRAGKLDGDVTVTYRTGHVFEGEFVHDTGVATGRLTTPDGSMLSGEIKDGKAVGSALVYYQTDEGELYFGDSKDGKRDGLGTLVKPDTSTYFGGFSKGLAEGAGVFKGADGRQFYGEFDGGAPNGVGTVVDAEGTTFQGRYVAGVPDGLILVTNSDGSQITEIWKNGSKMK